MAKIKRADLAKEFDEIVKQEVVNHNKQLLATNIALNEMRGMLSQLKHEFASAIAKEEAEYARMREFCEQNKALLTKESQRTWNAFDKLENEFSESSQQLRAQGIDLESCHDQIDEILYTLQDLSEEMKQCQDSLTQHRQAVHAELWEMEIHLEHAFEDFKRSVAEEPDRILPVKRELEQQIQTAVVDAKGIQRKLDAVLKDQLIINKKIENIYTLIDRLKKPEQA